MMNWLRRMMYGRYGSDSLNNALLVLCLAMMLAGQFFAIHLIVLLALALLLLCYFRMFSRNIPARYAENQKFLHVFTPFTRKISAKRAQWKDRKNHRYLKCPNCKMTLRVPRGRGKISVSCPKCKNQFITKS